MTTQIGPFTVIALSHDSAQYLATGPHGLEKVPKRRKTEGHKHSFVSFYIAMGLVLINGETIHELPTNALVIVPKGVDHSWKPKGKSGFVGSIDCRHEKQVLVDA